MVKGLEKFKEHFAGFEDNYVVICGTACDIALRDTDMRPRATDDIDMILVIEKMTPEFGQRFWNFIVEGEYETRQRKREDKEPITELFRFINPKNGFPVQIELLSKYPDVLGEPTGFHLTPIPVGEEIPSLSAILLDEEYYRHTIDSSIIEEGIRIAEHQRGSRIGSSRCRRFRLRYSCNGYRRAQGILFRPCAEGRSL